MDYLALIPNEILDRIINYIDFKSLLLFMTTCKLYNQIIPTLVKEIRTNIIKLDTLLKFPNKPLVEAKVELHNYQDLLTLLNIAYVTDIDLYFDINYMEILPILKNWNEVEKKKIFKVRKIDDLGSNQLMCYHIGYCLYIDDNLYNSVIADAIKCFNSKAIIISSPFCRHITLFERKADKWNIIYQN